VRSLRLRFFLISWPLVVAAIAIVALSVDRLTVVELERIEKQTHGPVGRAPRAAWADALGAAWSALPGSEGQALLARLAAGAEPPVDLVVLGNDGAMIATTDTAIRTAPGGRGEDGAARLLRAERLEGGVTSESEFFVVGIPVRDAANAVLGELFVLPKQPPPAPRTTAMTADGRAGLRRTIWAIAAVASFASAAAALLLAGPLVRQVRRLTLASAAIRDGALDTRVSESGSDEIAALGRSFNAMARSLQQAESHKRNLVTDVAHELRTPLTNIIGLVEAIQDGLRPPDTQTLASLRDEAGLLAALVDELQELSLAESGQLAFDIEAVDAVAAANAAVEAIRPGSGGVDVRGPDLAGSVLVRADARRLAQILRNLLRNAITNTPAGGRVTVEVTAMPARVAITVADTGHGIPPEHLPLIWERFHRVDPSRDRASGGMGLGLALVRQLAVGMGGNVGVESEVGRGSRFRVELPIWSGRPA
jgi:signal transduction histidine kinase